jgi:hypothetical protein
VTVAISKDLIVVLGEEGEERGVQVSIMKNAVPSTTTEEVEVSVTGLVVLKKVKLLGKALQFPVEI